MRFEERLNELISREEVPDELSPKSIAKMLKEHAAQPKMIAEHRNMKAAPSISAQRRTIIIRTAAAAAACTVFAAGMLAYNGKRAEQEQLEDMIIYEAIQPEDYDELYNIYTGINLTNGDTDSVIPDTDRTIDDELDPENETAVSDTDTGGPIEYTAAPQEDTLTDTSSYDFTDKSGINISEADITKCDGNYMYCLKGNTLYIVSLETMEVVSEIESTLDPPVELYIDGDSVILVSRETEEIQVVSGRTNSSAANSSDTENSAGASNVPADDVHTNQSDESDSDIYDPAVDEETGQADSEDADRADWEDRADKTDTAWLAVQESPEEQVGSGEQAGLWGQTEADSHTNTTTLKTVSRSNTVVDIYDVSDAAAPVKTLSYKQNGSYTASRLVDGTLYMVTAYSDYRVKPLDTQADLDSFVPAYYIDGEKHYLAAKDITIPAGANSTDYTVVSAIKLDGKFTASVKAVLGSSSNVYCSADTLYTVGTGKRDIEYSIISAFDLSEGGITYRASGSVEGIALGQKSMNEFGGKFRIASKITGEDGDSSVSVYVLNRSLIVVNSAGILLPGRDVKTVRFEENYARLIEADGTVTVLDLSADPPALSQSPIGKSAHLYSYDDMLLALGDNEGRGMTLTMYSRADHLILGSVTFADDAGETFSRAFNDRRAVLADADQGIIGVPVYSHSEFGTRNQYFVYCFDREAGFVRKGVIEYTDIDDSLIFERGEIIDDTLYVISKGRIISARLSDLKVIGSYEY
ncbi:MAG: beta-propeller domain-containing protein [Oscillospiraceae bacterium]|nr:beta-propeller domain-containing protein [Oscillospiraceae bacterium]